VRGGVSISNGKRRKWWKLQDLVEDRKFLASLGRRYDFQVENFCLDKFSSFRSFFTQENDPVPSRCGTHQE
jgi:hypothetical protein